MARNGTTVQVGSDDVKAKRQRIRIPFLKKNDVKAILTLLTKWLGVVLVDPYG